ncbi:SGNH hydrolase domain-containing protein [Pectobacterium versatile]|uniref:SGNH hydrolase domain-containing protein n=1 Tax=Pectobacterium versatile TaxID=2488639 RepID=UPI00384A8801
MKSGTNPPTILLLGNSYANQLYPGFAKNEKLKHQTILSIGTCGVGFDNSGDDPRSPCYGSRITDQAKFIDDIIKRTPSIKFVILDGLSRQPSSDEIARVIQRIDFLEKQGVKVIIFTPHIRPRL